MTLLPGQPTRSKTISKQTIGIGTTALLRCPSIVNYIPVASVCILAVLRHHNSYGFPIYSILLTLTSAVIWKWKEKAATILRLCGANSSANSICAVSFDNLLGSQNLQYWIQLAEQSNRVSHPYTWIRIMCWNDKIADITLGFDGGFLL